MNVKDLIDVLSKVDPSLPVCYRLHSEHCLLKPKDIKITKLQLARQDGWVHSFDKDSFTVDYLELPGN